MREFMVGLMTSRVAAISPDHTIGVTKPLQIPARFGNIGSSTAYSTPTSADTTTCIKVPASSPATLRLCNSSVLACASEGTTPAASRLMGYQGLPVEIRPKIAATIAMAAPPASPPFTPDEYG